MFRRMENEERTVYKKPLKYDTIIGLSWSKRSGFNTSHLVDGFGFDLLKKDVPSCDKLGLSAWRIRPRDLLMGFLLFGEFREE